MADLEGHSPSEAGPVRLIGWDILSILLIIYFVLMRVWWACSGHFALGADDVAVFRHAVAAFDEIKLNKISLSPTVPGFGAPYPPVVPLVASLHFLVFGHTSVGLAIASTWVWDLLLGLAAWLGGRRLWPAAGTLAVALAPLLVTDPLIRNGFFIEPALSALTLAALVCLDASDLLRRRGWCLWAGVALGLGLLTKWTFAFFAFVPTALYVAMALWKRVGGRLGVWLASSFILTAVAVVGFALHKLAWPWTIPPMLLFVGGLGLAVWLQRTGGLLVSLLVMLFPLFLLVAPWYTLNYSSLLAFMAQHQQGNFDGGIPMELGWYTYLAALLGPLLGTCTALLLLVGALRLLWPSAPSGPRLSLVGLIVGILVLTAIPWRTVRYLTGGISLALLPMVYAARGRFLREGVLLVAIGCSLFYQQSWLATSWNDSLRMKLPASRDNTYRERRFLGSVPYSDGDVTGELRHMSRLWPGFHLELLTSPPSQDGRLAAEVMAHLVGACAQPFNMILLTQEPWQDLRFLEGPLTSAYVERKGNVGGVVHTSFRRPAPGEPPPSERLVEVVMAVDRPPPQEGTWVTHFEGKVKSISGPASLWVGIRSEDQPSCLASSPMLSAGIDHPRP